MSDAWVNDPMAYLCEVPKSLGRVTGIKQRDGKVYVTTASGVEMIVPTGGLNITPKEKPPTP